MYGWMWTWLGCSGQTEPNDAPPDPEPSDTDTDTDTGTDVPDVDSENVLFVLLDDVGTEVIGLYEPSLPTPPTPVIDGLAAEGLLFRNAWSMPLCSPTRAALMTGRYPSRTTVGQVPENGNRGLPDAELTIPELLRDAPVPWDSSLAGKWHLSPYTGPKSRTSPADQGFAWHSGPIGNLQPHPYEDQGRGYYDWEENDNGTIVQQTTYATTDTADDAIARIGAMTEPWFLYLAFSAPHSPYEAPPESLVPGPIGDDRMSRYLASITAVDAELGRVLDAMPAALRARTTIVVMGDNGTDADVAPERFGRLKATVYEGGVRVPMVVTGPRVGAPGATTDALVDVVDWFPTIAGIAGVDPQAAATAGPIDGVSLLPVLADPAARVRTYAYSEAFFSDETYVWGIRDAQYKLVAAEGWPYLHPSDPGGLALYDLSSDPGETTDLSGDPAMADVFARLTTEAETLRADMGAP
jgi:arylsulfatase B